MAKLNMHFFCLTDPSTGRSCMLLFAPDAKTIEDQVTVSWFPTELEARTAMQEFQRMAVEHLPGAQFTRYSNFDN